MLFVGVNICMCSREKKKCFFCIMFLPLLTYISLYSLMYSSIYVTDVLKFCIGLSVIDQMMQAQINGP